MKRLTRLSIPFCVSLGLVVVILLALGSSVYANNVTVNTLVDESDGQCGGGGNPGSDGDCSLRDAIEYANGNAGADAITFSSGGVISLTLDPLVIDDDGTTIEGDLDADGDPDVEVRYVSGDIGGGGGLFRIRSAGNTLSGLAVTHSPENGIYIEGNGSNADGNLIEHCWVGLDLDGNDRGNTKGGVRIASIGDAVSSADDNTVRECVISGNEQRGIDLYTAGTTRLIQGTQILSNVVGLDPTGSAAIPNGTNTASTYSAITLDTVTTSTVQGNLVSGNTRNGIYLDTTQGTVILGNIVGLNAAGTTAIANQGTAGIYITAGSSDITIRGNTVSGNLYNGIYLGDGSHQATIAGNRIGTDITGMLGLGNGRATNRDGIQIEDAYDLTVGGPALADRNVIAHNGRAGVFISGDLADDNVVQNNYIGTAVDGVTDLGNGDGGSSTDTGDGGVYIYNGADSNVVQDNLVRFNFIGVRISGGATVQQLPPQGNELIGNTITTNDKYGIVGQNTHGNVAYLTPSEGDNLIQDNTVSDTGCALTWCTGIGIFNYGSSPRIVSNTITGNDDFGIINTVYFGTDGPANAADDLLSMPTIGGNTISSNGNDGVRSVDTAPLNKATLLVDNTFGNNSGYPHISQRWFVAVEVVSATETIDSGMVVTITRQDGGNTCASGDCNGSTFASDGGGDGIWGDTGISYTDVELAGGTTSWFNVIEYEVTAQGNWITYTSHLVQAGGAYAGVRYYDFDGIDDAAETTGDTHLPFCVDTGDVSGPYNLCRYQIAQIDVFGSSGDGDADDDGIPDGDEGTGDTDGDGTPDYLDEDSDGDGVPDQDEGTGDTDGDGTPDFQDTDDDGDGIDTIDEDLDGDGDPTNDDTDGDGTPDYLDDDDDDDGIPTIDEDPDGDGDPTNDDTDGDGTPDYLDDDDDGDGIPTIDEDPDGNGDPTNDDTDGDGTPDYLDDDDDGDGIPTDEECPSGAACQDSDGDGIPDYLDDDADGDGIDDMIEAGCTDTNGDGQADSCPAELPDADGDGIPDYLEDNDDDVDGDGNPNYDDTDSDGDEIDDDDEYYSGGTDVVFCADVLVDTDGDEIPNCQDNDVDGDGIPNYLDGDSDGDGIADSDEAPGDSDGDGIPNYLDPDAAADPQLVAEGGDSDGDGISDADEYWAGVADVQDFALCTPPAALDSDGDGTPNYVDNDVDGDGFPNYLDLDADGDDVPDQDEPIDELDPAPFTTACISSWNDPLWRIKLPLIMRYH